MEFGIGYFPTHDAVGPGALARLVEERGHESLFFAEHTHIPASRETPYPGGGELPRKYMPHLRPVRRADRGGRGDLDAAGRQRHLPGRSSATRSPPPRRSRRVDHLSGGRFEFGVGAGWNREEMANHGTDPRTRMRLMRERVEAMKAIWTAGRGELPRRVRRLRPDLVVAQARCSARIRRCSSAATGRRCSTACSRSATAGCPTTGAGPDRERIAELRARAERPIDVQVDGPAARRGGARAAARRPAPAASCTGSRRRAAAVVERDSSAGRQRRETGESPSSTARRESEAAR